MTARPDKIKRLSREEALAKALKTMHGIMRPEDTRPPLAPDERPDFTAEMLTLLRCAGTLFSAIRSSAWTLEVQLGSPAELKVVVALSDAAHNLTMLANSLEGIATTGAGIRTAMHDAKHLIGTFGGLQKRVAKAEIETHDLGLAPCIDALKSIHDRLDALN